LETALSDAIKVLPEAFDLQSMINPRDEAALFGLKS